MMLYFKLAILIIVGGFIISLLGFMIYLIGKYAFLYFKNYPIESKLFDKSLPLNGREELNDEKN